MNKQILILLIFVPTMMFAQKTKKVTDSKTNEKYYVLKSDKKVRHGEYKRSDIFGMEMIRGHYNMGVRDSIWECFFRGNLVSKYDFINNKIIVCEHCLETKGKSYRVIEDGNKIDAILSRPPIFLGGDLYMLIMNEFRMPIAAIEKKISGRMTVTTVFTVDNTGLTSNFQSKTQVGYGMEEEVKRIYKTLPDLWLPGIVGENPVDVEVEHSISFSFAESLKF